MLFQKDPHEFAHAVDDDEQDEAYDDDVQRGVQSLGTEANVDQEQGRLSWLRVVRRHRFVTHPACSHGAGAGADCGQRVYRRDQAVQVVDSRVALYRRLSAHFAEVLCRSHSFTFYKQLKKKKIKHFRYHDI